MTERALARIAAVLSVLIVGSLPLLARELNFEERVEAQRAIEEVYWHHRIWPAANPGAKPALSAVVPDEAIRAKVEDYLKLSQALEIRWARPLTTRGIQAELARMVRNSRDPRMLRELFAALDDDPGLIAETLARPTLARRLARQWYARDERLHGSLEAKARATLQGITDVPGMRALGERYFEQTFALSPSARHGNLEVELDPASWQAWTDALADRFHVAFEEIPLGRPSELQEDSERFFVEALLARTEGQATTATLSWPKRSFDSWWREERHHLAPELPEDGGPYELNAPDDAPCEEDTWDKRFYGPGSRSAHTAIWTGSEMIVWGGHYVLDTGGRYDPATDTWLSTPTGDGAPIGRQFHTAVWTGTEMIVWGGMIDGGGTATGGRYNPLTDQWSPTAMGVGTPDVRADHTAVWTGSEMIVWGGAMDNSGGRYDPRTDSWTPTSVAAGCPSPRWGARSVWTGSEMLVWGGGSDGGPLNSGGRYDPDADSWVSITAGPGVPSPRFGHSMVWTGNRMIVWGGGDTSTFTQTGGRYDPVTDQWTPTATTDAPAARQYHAAVWTGTAMIVWGGQATDSGFPLPLNSGGRYVPATNSWSPTSLGANVPSPRALHAAIWTGDEMITWGGQGQGGAQYDDGGRYDPTGDSWFAIVPDPGVPLGRHGHTAVWTGAEMIVWGGFNGGYLYSGGRYDPALDVWDTTFQDTAPLPRYHHTAVWTGTEMIVWGGFVQFPTMYLNNGGRFNPSTDSWIPTSTAAGTPAGREGHTAVWTGTHMVVWGGVCCEPAVYYNTGGRYDPVANNWAPTNAGANAPSSRVGHTAVWTGTEMIVWGGLRLSTGSYWNTGGRYDPGVDTWSPTTTAGDTPAGRASHTAVWTGTEMIVWGGRLDDGPGPAHPLDTGGRYAPETNSWLPTATTGAVPEPRDTHTATWVQDRMLVWGGYDGQYQTVGGAYEPAQDEWSPMSTTNGPQGRLGHSAVTDGTRMIIWGGDPYVTDVDIYCPTACVAAVPSHSTRLVAEQSRVGFQWSWDAVPGAQSYDVVMGSLSLLRSSDGDYTASTTGCLANDLQSTVVTDGTAPEVGGGLWYLVRPINCAGSGSYDQATASQEESCDAEIASSPVACP